MTFGLIIAEQSSALRGLSYFASPSSRRVLRGALPLAIAAGIGIRFRESTRPHSRVQCRRLDGTARPLVHLKIRDSRLALPEGSDRGLTRTHPHDRDDVIRRDRADARDGRVLDPPYRICGGGFRLGEATAAALHHRLERDGTS